MAKDAAGNVTELVCSYAPTTRSGGENAGRTVKGTNHWVSARHAVRTEVRLYDRLFRIPFPGNDLTAELNPESLEIVPDAALEPALASVEPNERFQVERLGYFSVDPVLSRPNAPVFNRTVTLRDSWAKLEAEAAASQG